MKRKKTKPYRKAEPTERVPSVAARVVHRKARERAENKIIRGNTEIAKDLERQAGFTSRSRDLHDQIRVLLMREAAAALRQSDRIRPDDLRLEDPAKLFEHEFVPMASNSGRE